MKIKCDRCGKSYVTLFDPRAKADHAVTLTFYEYKYGAKPTEKKILWKDLCKPCVKIVARAVEILSKIEVGRPIEDRLTDCELKELVQARLLDQAN